MRESTHELTIGEVASKYPQAIGILNRYHIDYCCGGAALLETACAQAGREGEDVWQEILDARSGGATVDFARWSAPLLVDYIVDQHHSYVKEAIPVLTELLEKICRVHGVAHPELMEIQIKFQMLAEELLQHMVKEERVLFPAIRSGSTLSLRAPIQVMEEEHELAGNLIKEIRLLSGNYKCPENVCLTYEATYQQLQAFDHDLMQHIHLENNVLFRKVGVN